MTDRDKFILRMALIYLRANYDEAFEAFVKEEFYEQPTETRKPGISVDGEEGMMPTYDEIAQLMKELQ